MAADQFGNGNQGLINENPQVYATENTCIIEDTPLTLRDFLENRVECDEDELDPITSTEIFGTNIISVNAFFQFVHFRENSSYK